METLTVAELQALLAILGLTLKGRAPYGTPRSTLLQTLLEAMDAQPVHPCHTKALPLTIIHLHRTLMLRERYRVVVTNSGMVPLQAQAAQLSMHYLGGPAVLKYCAWGLH